jgi:hypothetical protein
VEEGVRGILATTKVNREMAAENELGSLAILRNIAIGDRAIRFSGGVLMIVENPLKLYRASISVVLAEPLRLYPLLRLSDLMRLKNSISLSGIECVVRNNMRICETLLQNVRSLFSEGKKDLKAKLSVQGVKEAFGYSLLPEGCERYGVLMEDRFLKRICYEFSVKIERMIES